MGSQRSIIQERIQQMSEGTVFTYANLSDENIPPQALAVVLSRLVKQGILRRLSKGRYGKFRQTRFGAILPSDSQILESILRPKAGQLTGYVSGIAAYNRMGLTTQVPSEIMLVGAASSRRSKIGKLRVRFFRSSITVTEETQELLPILDAIRDIKRIPDASVDEVAVKIRAKIEQLETSEKNKLAEVAINYAPRVRALLGSIFESLGEERLAKVQRENINPISTYTIGINKSTLPNAASWNIR